MAFVFMIGGALILGGIAGGAFVYLYGNYRAKIIEAERNRDDTFFANLSVQQRAWLSSEGRFLKDEYLNVEERLIYKQQFPLTQWIAHKRLLKQSIDSKAMTGMAQVVSQLALDKIPIRTAIQELVGR
jgi:hypothetical protein